LAVQVAGANRHDVKLAQPTLESLVIQRPKPTRKNPQGLCLDKGYDSDEIRGLLAEFGFTAHISSRKQEAQKIKRKAGYKARRWVVERTHSWMNRFRRLLIRWEKKADNYIAMLHLACAIITWRSVRPNNLSG